MIEKLIHLNRNKKLKIICVGDSMQDVYKYGDIEKISQEFPIPILHSLNKHELTFPGGSLNVAYQFKFFNVEVFIISFLDKEIKDTLFKYDLKTEYCISLKNGFIPKKIRYYNDNFPLLRHDIESPNYNELEDTLLTLRDQIINKFDDLMSEQKIDAVIMSDYNKGFWSDHLAQHIIQECNKQKIITIVDPKQRPLNKWNECSILKLNSKEAFHLTNETNIKKQSDILQKEVNCISVIVTNAGLGLYGKHKEEYFQYKPDKISKEVNSTVGAGDFCAAALALSLSHGLDIINACAIAFKGGTEYVKNRHNCPISLHDIYKQLDSTKSKIIELEELLFLKNNYLSGKWVFSNGCFDIIHAGHLETLKYAKAQGDYLIVAVNTDSSVKKLKGKNRPIISLKERMEMLSAIEYVDFVIYFDEDTPYELIKVIKPNILIKSSEYQEENIVGRDLVEHVTLAPYINGFSTTNIIEKIKSTLTFS